MNASHDPHPLGPRLKERMPKKAADELRRPIIRDIQPDQAITVMHPIAPIEVLIKLIENNPYHDARAFERRLAAADFRVSNDVAAEFDASGLIIRLRFHASAIDYAAAKDGLQHNTQP